MNVGFFDAGIFGCGEECKEVCDVRMNSTVGDKTKEMETTVSIFGGIQCFDYVLLFCKFSLFNGLIDTYEVLEVNKITIGIAPAKQLYQHQCSNVRLLSSIEVPKSGGGLSITF